MKFVSADVIVCSFYRKKKKRKRKKNNHPLKAKFIFHFDSELELQSLISRLAIIDFIYCTVIDLFGILILLFIFQAFDNEREQEYLLSPNSDYVHST